MNPDIEAIVAELIKRNTDNIEAEIRKSSPYSSKINKYISSMEELSFYQRLCLQEKYVIRQSLIQPAINLTDMDVHGKTNYERKRRVTPKDTRIKLIQEYELLCRNVESEHLTKQQIYDALARKYKVKKGTVGSIIYKHYKGKDKEAANK